MKPINREQAIALVERSLQTDRRLVPDMPEEQIIDVREIPYGWYFKIGMKNLSCSTLYYGAYTDYIVDRDYRFMHIVNRLDPEEEIVRYGEKRKEWGTRLWWRFAEGFKRAFIGVRLSLKALSK